MHLSLSLYLSQYSNHTHIHTALFSTSTSPLSTVVEGESKLSIDTLRYALCLCTCNYYACLLNILHMHHSYCTLRTVMKVTSQYIKQLKCKKLLLHVHVYQKMTNRRQRWMVEWLIGGSVRLTEWREEERNPSTKKECIFHLYHELYLSYIITCMTITALWFGTTMAHTLSVEGI